MNALVSPGFSLTTSWVELYLDPLFLGSPLTKVTAPVIAVSADDTVFMGSQDVGLWSYSMTTGSWVWINTYYLGPALPVAPVNANAVYAGIGVQWNGPTTPLTITYFNNGQQTNLPLLPNQDQPLQMAASGDGQLWVLGQSGTVYQISGQTWTPVPNGSLAILNITHGGPKNTWAIARIGGATQVVEYIEGKGWQPDTTFPGKSPEWISACEDGSLWVVVGTTLYLRTTGQNWQLLTATIPQPGTVSGFSASSQYRCYVSLTDANGNLTVQCLSLGVVDRTPVPWPAMTAAQQNVYNAISWYVIGSKGSSIRSLYPDKLADLDILFTKLESWTYTEFVAWYTGNENPPVPSQADWSIVIGQVTTELAYAAAMRKLQGQLKDLNNQIAIVNGEVLPTVWGMVGLSAPQGPDKESSIDLWLGNIVEGLAWGIATVFTDGAAAFAAAAVASLMGSGISAIEGPDHKPLQNNNALTIKYAALVDTLTQFYLNANLLTDKTTETVVQDWGMMSAVGSTINSGKWFWPETESDLLAAAAKDSFEVSFYQSLIPAKWQILYTLWGNYIEYDWTYTPVFTTYKTPVTNTPPGSLPVENVWFCNLLGNPSHVSSSMDEDDFSPYPDPGLFSRLMQLGVDLDDFFLGNNGWALQEATLVFE
ncbi:MAG: hypothetical protein WAT91_12730 [Saprospiraceae bacterium]